MKDFSELKAKIERLARQCPRFVDEVLPHAVATVAANHFKENFHDESRCWRGLAVRAIYFNLLTTKKGARIATDRREFTEGKSARAGVD